MCGRLGLATNTLRLFPDAVESCSRSFGLGCCVTCFDWKDVAKVMGQECQGRALRQLEASPFPLWEASCHALKNVIGSDQGFSIRKKIASGPLAMPGDIFWLSQLGVCRRMGEGCLWHLEGRSHWIFQRFYKQNTEQCLIGKKKKKPAFPLKVSIVQKQRNTGLDDKLWEKQHAERPHGAPRRPAAQPRCWLNASERVNDLSWHIWEKNHPVGLWPNSHTTELWKITH